MNNLFRSPTCSITLSYLVVDIEYSRGRQCRQSVTYTTGQGIRFAKITMHATLRHDFDVSLVVDNAECETVLHVVQVPTLGTIQKSISF